MNSPIRKCKFCEAPIYNYKLVYCSPHCRELDDIKRINQSWVEGRICNNKRPPSTSLWFEFQSFKAKEK